MAEFDPVSYSKANKVAAQMADMTNYPHRKRISITGTGKDETDYILKLNVHRGFPQGDLVGTDIFLENRCKTDFSDVRFFANGQPLEYYLESHGNYEIIYDHNRLGYRNIVRNGAIYASRIGYDPHVPGIYRGHGVFKSTDNGQTWQKISPNGPTESFDIIFINSKGYIFASDKYDDVWRSIDDGKNWTKVLTPGESGRIEYGNMAEDSLGNLYAGRYQSTLKKVAIFKSTDDGETWDICYTKTDTNVQHIHCIFVDPYTDYIYATMDGSGNENKHTIRSTDHGETWEIIRSGSAADSTVILFFPGYRLFAGGNTSSCVAVWKTTNDKDFEPMLPVGASIQGAAVLGGHIYWTGTAVNTNIYAQIYQTDLEGNNGKTIWIGEYETVDGFIGNRGLYPDAIGTPIAATERHILLGASTTSESRIIKHARLFEGGQHYQALFHVKIPHLPADGLDIDIVCGNPSAVSLSEKTKLYPYPGIALPNPVMRLLIDEGEGTIIHDISGNGRHGTLTHTEGKGEWEQVGGRRAGGSYPWITIGDDRYSYKFKGGDSIVIPADDVLDSLNKNFSIVLWMKTTHTTVPINLIKKGSGNNIFALQVRSPNNYVAGVQFGNGSATTQKIYVSGQGLNNGEWHMIGVMIDDTEPIVKMYLIVDGRVVDTGALSYNPVIVAGEPWVIGDNSTYANICDVQIYPYVLTQQQVAQLYENRLLADTEPKVVTTLV